ncbi:MAG TPA: site-specific integrase [Candidatus Acidoferrum sp.]|nr:site-specific integrase [Candidatus Acidoferrum sp.]
MSRRRGSGSVFRQAGTDNWTIQYYARGGKRIRESLGSDDYKAAQQLLTQRLSAIDKGEFVERPAKPKTVAELFEELRRHYRVNKRRSLGSLEFRWKHLKALADFLAVHVDKDCLSAYVDERLKEGASNASVNRELSALKTAFHLGQVPRMPKFPHLAENNARVGFVEQHQFDQMVKHADQPWLRLYLELAYTYGWRRGELLHLRVEQVDLLEKTLRLDPIQTKNARPREVAMTATAYELIKQAVVGKNPTDRLLTRGLKPVRDFRESWQKLCVKAALGKFTCRTCENLGDGDKCKCGSRAFKYAGTTPHDFRRSAARQLRKAGIAESTIMDMAGWATREMFKRYAVTDSSDIRNAVEKLEQARVENSHSFSHSRPSEQSAQAEAAKGMIQ